MKKLLNKLRVNEINELALWTAISGLVCVLAMLIMALVFAESSSYISNLAIKSAFRLTAQTVFYSAIVDLIFKYSDKE